MLRPLLGCLPLVALRKESVDRNMSAVFLLLAVGVALRKESVDRNIIVSAVPSMYSWSLSARRAWIEIRCPCRTHNAREVALRKESVDRNLD